MKTNHCWGSPFSEQDIQLARTTGKLLTMELELSHLCNLRCIYCYAESGLPLDNELSYEEIIEVIDQAKCLGARRIIVLGGGEPMAYPRIMDVLRAINGRGLEIELFTNGTLLSPDVAREFYRLGVHPVIKCNSLIPNIQDMLAGTDGAFAAISHGLELLLQAGYPEGLTLGAQTVVCQQNLDELPTMWRWLRQQGIIPYFETITAQGRAVAHPDLAVTPQNLRLLFDELARIDSEEFGVYWEAKPPVAAFTCRRHFFSCTVTAIGDVIPCPGVNLVTGNIRQDALGDILTQSPVFKELRNIRENIKGACRTCDLSNECYGCRGMAYQSCGDYLAADPLCWRCPSTGAFS